MTDFSDRLEAAAERIGKLAADSHDIIVTAESCTGGGIAELLTRVPGSSGWVEGGWIVYTPEAKIKRLDVPAETIDREGVVSEAVALAMARGALARSVNATLAVSVTGVAGPGGGTPETPVGTVCIGWAQQFNEHIVCYARTFDFHGGREAVRDHARLAALEGLADLIKHDNPARFKAL